MGNWNISINGIGCHHNRDLEDDADRMAQKFVAYLKECGHTIESATFTHGGAESLMDCCAPGVKELDAYKKGFEDAEVKLKKAESVRLHREYNKLVGTQLAPTTKNAEDVIRMGAEVIRITDECAARGIVLVPGDEG